MSHPLARINHLALWAAIAGCALPAAGDAAPYQRRWYVSAGGGAIPTTTPQNSTRVSGTVGQPAAAVLRSGAYRVVGGFWSGPFGSAFVDVPIAPVATPSGFRAFPPHPNPSRAATTLAFELAAPCDVQVRVLDVQGRVIRALERARYGAGRHEIVWDGRDGSGAPAPRGLYFVHIDAGHDRGVSRLVLLPEGGAR